MEEVEMAREMVAVGLMIYNVIGYNKPSPFLGLKYQNRSSQLNMLMQVFPSLADYLCVLLT